jgi:hypothetical protein
MGEPSATHRRRELARMVEAGLYFFGVTDLEDFEGLLSDDEQRTMLRSWLRSEHVARFAVGTADQAVAADEARAAAEIDILGNELRAMELKARCARRRAAKVMLHVHVGLPRAAQRSVTAQTEAAPKLKVATVGMQFPTPSEAANRQREEDERQQLQREQGRQQAMADIRPVLEQASAARRAAARSLAAAQDIRNANHASHEKAALEAAGTAADRADAAKDRAEAEALRATARAEAARADRATATEAMLLREIYSIDMNDLHECHKALQRLCHCV